jgi:hypothetical protein
MRRKKTEARKKVRKRNNWRKMGRGKIRRRACKGN